MPPRVRIALVLVGLLLVTISLLALAYAWAPASIHTEQINLAPTLFSPPGVLP